MRKGFRQAPLLAPIAKARKTGVSDDKLNRFNLPFTTDIDVIDSPEDADLQPALRLKHYIESGKLKAGASGEVMKFYGLTVRALKCFLAGEKLPKSVKPATDDNFVEYA